MSSKRNQRTRTVIFKHGLQNQREPIMLNLFEGDTFAKSFNQNLDETFYCSCEEIDSSDSGIRYGDEQNFLHNSADNFDKTARKISHTCLEKQSSDNEKRTLTCICRKKHRNYDETIETTYQIKALPSVRQEDKTKRKSKNFDRTNSKDINESSTVPPVGKNNREMERRFKSEMSNYLEDVQNSIRVALNFDKFSSFYYAIVTTLENLCTHYSEICVFMGILEEKGFEIIVQHSIMNPETIFILINATDEVLHHFAEIHGIDLMRDWDDQVIIKRKLPFKFLATELTRQNPQSLVYQRAPLSVSGEKPIEITTSEKIMITSKVLSVASFGPGFFDSGINELLKSGAFQTAFPLHDGDWKWTEEGPLNDRQLLAKYWSRPSCWYKQQPLDLIQKYYGTEVAFYFAWLGFYNKMLIPASIIGILCFLYGLITLRTKLNLPSTELCNSDIILCPKCRGHCKFSYLNKSCAFSMLTYLCDNEATVCFAILMSFWATAFMQLWNREQAILQLRWNVETVELDTTERNEFVRKVNKTKMSSVTGRIGLYEPFSKRCYRYTLTTSTIILLMIFVICVFFAIMIYHMALIYWLATRHKDTIVGKNVEFAASVFASIVTVLFIMLFGMIYEKISTWLTDFENPRTQMEYDNSFIYKSYLLSFVNSYATTFYIAFFKGKFYTHPGNMNNSLFGGMRSDLCDPAGCIANLCIQLFTVVIMKYILGNVIEVITPMVTIRWKKMRTKTQTIDKQTLPIWEKDYLLNSIGYFYLIREYTEIIIQYGYVVFFVAAFPLAPFLAFINNVAEIRIDAQKYLLHCRRPVPKRVSGIGAWNGLLQAATYLGIITNAFVIAFTSGFVPRNIYRNIKNINLEGYVNSTLSKFDISDGDFDPPTAGLSTCYYPNKRYPPEHERKYELTEDYWFELLVRFIVVIIFENVVIILNGILAYAIPDVPRSVRTHLSNKINQIKEQKVQSLKQNYRNKRTAHKSATNTFAEQSMAIINEFT